MPLAKGHQMVITRKGGAYSFDAWFKMTPPGVEIYNPAFDVTPANYITAFITETGVVYPEPDFETALTMAVMGTDSIHQIGIRRDSTDLVFYDDAPELNPEAMKTLGSEPE